MALLLLESFDDGLTRSRDWWYGFANLPITLSANSRTGTNSAQTGDNTNQQAWLGLGLKDDLTLPSKAYTGFGYRPQDIGNDPSRILVIYAGGGETFTIYVRASGAIYATGPWGTGSDSSTGVLPIGSAFKYVEVMLDIDNSAGAYEVRVEGVTAISESSIDTQGGASTTWSHLYWPGSFGTLDMDRAYIDDFYLCDDSGTDANDFLGTVKIYNLLPDGNGNTSDMVNSTGTSANNYSYVDELTPSSTGYVGGSSIGQKDTYSMSGLPSTQMSVHGVMTTVWGAAVSTEAIDMAHVVRTGTTGGTPSDNLSTSFTYDSTVYNLPFDVPWSANPDTSTTWTEGEITEIEVGQVIT